MIVPFRPEQEIRTGLDLRQAAVPWRVAIAAHHGHQPVRHRSSPTGRGIIRYFKPRSLHRLQQMLHVRFRLGSAESSGMTVFVLDLHADHRTALRGREFRCLLPDSFDPSVRVPQISGIVAAQPESLCLRFADEPVRQTAISRLSMRPRSDPQETVQPVFFHQCQELPQIAVSCPVFPSLDLLMVQPEQIRRNDLHPAAFHADEIRLPHLRRHAGEMHLSHHGEPRPAVPRQALRRIGKIIHFRLFLRQKPG